MSGTCAVEGPPGKEEEQERERRLQERLSTIHHRWLVLSGKGGVGKSTVAVNLACALADRGQTVGLLDVDIHGPNVAKMLGIEEWPLGDGGDGIEPVKVYRRVKAITMASLMPDPDKAIIWRGPRKMGVIRQFLTDVHWGELDHLVVDAPPGTGDEPLSAAQLIGKADGAIIVTTPQEVAVLDARKCVDFARTVHLPVVGIVENMSGMVCPHCQETIHLFGSGGGREAARELSVPFLGSIPLDPAVVQSVLGRVLRTIPASLVRMGPDVSSTVTPQPRSGTRPSRGSTRWAHAARAPTQDALHQVPCRPRPRRRHRRRGRSNSQACTASANPPSSAASKRRCFASVLANASARSRDTMAVVGRSQLPTAAPSRAAREIRRFATGPIRPYAERQIVMWRRSWASTAL